MGHKYNPITEQIDITGCKDSEIVQSNNNFLPLTTFVSGKIIDIDDGYDNMIESCTLPITTERQIIDLGELSELCN